MLYLYFDDVEEFGVGQVYIPALIYQTELASKYHLDHLPLIFRVY